MITALAVIVLIAIVAIIALGIAVLFKVAIWLLFGYLAYQVLSWLINEIRIRSK